MRTRRVRAAMADISVRGSWRGRAVSESPTHTESKPTASARSAIASSGPVSGRPDITTSRVGMRTPNSTAIGPGSYTTEWAEGIPPAHSLGHLLSAPSEGDAEAPAPDSDRKSTRLNSSHGYISYAVFCLKKKTSNE